MWKQQLSKKYMYVCYLCWSAINSYLLTIFITANTVQHTGFNNKKMCTHSRGTGSSSLAVTVSLSPTAGKGSIPDKGVLEFQK
jgi:hypothetical protein